MARPLTACSGPEHHGVSQLLHRPAGKGMDYSYKAAGGSICKVGRRERAENEQKRAGF